MTNRPKLVDLTYYSDKIVGRSHASCDISSARFSPTCSIGSDGGTSTS